MKIKEKAHLVKTDVKANNNKYYIITLFEDDSVICEYGRVGKTPQTATGHGYAFYNRKLNEKIAKGYKEQDVLENVVSNSNRLSKSKLIELSNESLLNLEKIKTEEEKESLKALIEYFVQENKHIIEGFSSGRISVVDGVVKTAIGVVSLNSIQKARKSLGAISKNTSNDEFYNNINEYLMLVPQDLGTQRGWENCFLNSSFINDQSTFLDILEQTVKSQSYLANPDKENDLPKINFDFKISELKDKRTFNRIKRMFEDKIDKNHSSSDLKLKKVYVLEEKENKEKEANFDKFGNVKTLWHGTMSGNILSILKSGLVIPKSNSSHVTGRLFGDGVYFSDHSTKSLNYSNGFWHGSKKNRCFMFLADVAMGKVYDKHIKHYNYPRHGYDSTFAKGGENYERFGYLRHNEMIVYSLDQIKLKFLCEFVL